MFGGGPLSHQIGDALTRAGVNIRSLYGATEFGVPTTLELPHKKFMRTPDDWNYLSFSDLAKPRWVHQGDGTFELQFLVRQSIQQRWSNYLHANRRRKPINQVSRIYPMSRATRRTIPGNPILPRKAYGKCTPKASDHISNHIY